MSLVAFILLISVLVVPATALWALLWAGRNGQLNHPKKAALLPFDDEEPMDRPTDQILNQQVKVS